MKDCPTVNIINEFEQKRIISKFTYSKPQTRFFVKRKPLSIHSLAKKILIQEKAIDLAENTDIIDIFLKEIENSHLTQSNEKYRKRKKDIQ